VPLQRAAFNFWIPQWRWLHKLGRRIGFIPLMFSGLWGIPYAMPGPTPLNLVVGAPIVVPKMEGTSYVRHRVYITVGILAVPVSVRTPS
jgi:hypothetical protein